jgi:putative transposase
MEHYRKTAHSVYDIRYPIVWSTKYRKPIMRGKIAERTRELIREICKADDAEIMRGHISRDHVHLFVSVPPFTSVSKFVQRVKGKTSRKLLMEYRRLNKQFWGRRVWGRGYFVASSGNVTDEVIKQYLENQLKEPEDAEFKIEPE